MTHSNTPNPTLKEDPLAKTQQTLEAIARSTRGMATFARDGLFWLAGLPAEAVRTHRMDVQMRYTSVGLLVAVWYAFMLIVWAKTGSHYGGTPAAFAFCLAPTIMLALDRLIVGQTRSPEGELDAYAIAGLQPKRWEYVLRVFAALSFSAVTTQVFLVTHSTAEVRALQQREQEQANAPLRKELTGRIDAALAERTRTIASRTAELEAQGLLLRDDLAKARQVAEEAENKVRGAQFNIAAEIGGIEGRHAGAGPRHDGYALIARQSQDTAVNARARELRARDALAKIQVEQQQLAAERERAAAIRAECMANLDAAMQEDARFVRRKQGIFADGSALLRLFGDPQVGPGLLVGTVLAVMMLFVLEMSPLLGLMFLPATPFDVERIALSRADAARIVAQHELELMSSASRRDMRVRPIGPQDAPAQPASPAAAAQGEAQ